MSRWYFIWLSWYHDLVIWLRVLLSWYHKLLGFDAFILCPWDVDIYFFTMKSVYQSWTWNRNKLSFWRGVKRSKHFHLLPVHICLHMNRSKYLRCWTGTKTYTFRSFKRSDCSRVFCQISKNPIKGTVMSFFLMQIPLRCYRKQFFWGFQTSGCSKFVMFIWVVVRRNLNSYLWSFWYIIDMLRWTKLILRHFNNIQ